MKLQRQGGSCETWSGLTHPCYTLTTRSRDRPEPGSYKYYGAVFINGVRHDAYGGPGDHPWRRNPGRSAEPNIVDDSIDKIEEMMGGVFSDRSRLYALGYNYTITKEGNELKIRWSARPGVEAKRADKEYWDKFFADAQDRRAGAAAHPDEI